MFAQSAHIGPGSGDYHVKRCFLKIMHCCYEISVRQNGESRSAVGGEWNLGLGITVA